MAKLLGSKVDFNLVRRVMRRQLGLVFDLALEDITMEDVRNMLEGVQNESTGMVNA
ncbi:hypothetical protein SDC9_203141 [bioreactor metagenome]|uniref:Uncharacterized protein n=1 Tax=bioreactor metagenome TaxID=1076179 RepID=A0A645IYD4_9ZZZZ